MRFCHRRTSRRAASGRTPPGWCPVDLPAGHGKIARRADPGSFATLMCNLTVAKVDSIGFVVRTLRRADEATAEGMTGEAVAAELQVFPAGLSAITQSSGAPVTRRRAGRGHDAARSGIRARWAITAVLSTAGTPRADRPRRGGSRRRRRSARRRKHPAADVAVGAKQRVWPVRDHAASWKTRPKLT